MPSTAAALNPSLLAILLVAQGTAGSGAQVIFHYPPEPLSAERSHEQLASADEVDDESSSSDSEGSSSEDDLQLFATRVKNAPPQKAEARSRHSDEEEDDHYPARKPNQTEGDKGPSWEPLLGIGEDDLVSLLAPGRAWHKRRFELGINDLTFLGRPVYARGDGTWRKAKTKKTEKPEQEEGQDPFGTPSGDSGVDDSSDGDQPEKLEPPKPVKQPGYSSNQLTMFHVVFVMDPPLLEHTLRVKEMYDHVVKKFSKALKWEQSRNNYVWEQSELLLAIKSSHIHQHSSTAALYTEAFRKSSLAIAIRRVFDNISTSKIAAVTLSSKVSISLQIPPITSTSYLPSLTESPLEPGLWLTTATDPTSTASDLDSTGNAGALLLSKNFTLLLKANPQKIIKDVQTAGGPLAGPLSNFVAHAKPTKSFYKMSVKSQISLGDIQKLARHLIYWRRAIAIPPLHQRDTYIVSPNAPMGKLVSACKAYESAFPMMPGLPKMLKDLSGTPVPYGTWIPTADHKDEYYKVLAWLMREGWVTQLRTFGYVRVGPEVKKAVREKEHAAKSAKMLFEKENAAPTTPQENDAARSLGSSVASTTPNIYVNVPAHLKRPRTVSRPSSEGRQSISTDHTTNRANQGPPHNPKAASLILSTLRASPEESRWLDHIASTLHAPKHSPPMYGQQHNDRGESSSFSSTSSVNAEDFELRKYWPNFEKYFNGTEALERIPVCEGLKRKFVWDLLAKLGLDWESGVEDERGNQRQLVTVRHW